MIINNIFIQDAGLLKDLALSSSGKVKKVSSLDSTVQLMLINSSLRNGSKKLLKLVNKNKATINLLTKNTDLL